MGTAFSKADWEFVQEMGEQTGKQLKAKGASVSQEFEPLPKIAAKQCDEFRLATGKSLPQDFVDLVTNFAGGWNFSWHLSPIESPVYLGSRGGNGDDPFIGASKKTTLRGIHRSFELRMEDDLDRKSKTRKALPALFPLQFFEGGGPDFIVLRVDLSPACVYYLDHEKQFEMSDETLIGIGFRDFLLGWARLGFPAGEYYSSWVDPKTHQPLTSGPEFEKWVSWLADKKRVKPGNEKLR